MASKANAVKKKLGKIKSNPTPKTTTPKKKPVANKKVRY